MSPVPGYIRIRDPGGNHKGHHKDAIMQTWRGSLINVSHYLNDLKADWAIQLSIYSWLCGSEVGQEIITAIDQLVCTPSGLMFPNVKIAQHRLRVHSDFQWKVLRLAQDLWHILKTEPFHYFPELTLEESQEKCKVLEKQAQALAGQGTPLDKWFSNSARS